MCVAAAVGLAEPRGRRRQVWVRSPLLVSKKHMNQSASVQAWERKVGR